MVVHLSLVLDLSPTVMLKKTTQGTQSIDQGEFYARANTKSVREGQQGRPRRP
jgi:hypothetical protein